VDKYYLIRVAIYCPERYYLKPAQTIFKKKIMYQLNNDEPVKSRTISFVFYEFIMSLPVLFIERFWFIY